MCENSAFGLMPKPSIIPLYPDYINFFLFSFWLGEGGSHHFDKNINDMGSAWKLEKTHISLERVIYSSVVDILHITGSHSFSRLFMYHKKALISGGKKCALGSHSITPPLILLMDGTPHTRHSTQEHSRNADGHVDRTWGYLLIEEGKQISHHYKDRPGQG